MELRNKLMQFPLPHRARVEGGDGTYTTRPWELSDVLAALRAPGTYFLAGKHDFDSAATAEEAIKRSARGA